jgi:predicted nucleic acid-binding protein
MTSATDTAAAIAQRRRPVIYIDTCSILDLTRGVSSKFGPEHAAAALHILRLAESGELTLIFPQQVESELLARIGEVRRVGFKCVADLNSRVEMLRRPVLNIIQVFGGSVTADPRISELSFVEAANTVIDRFRSTATVSITTDVAKINAMDRVVLAKPPAHTSKQSAKDCLVLESCYETLRAARDQGFRSKAYFLSSNINDYSNNKIDLHPDLTIEFDALNLKYVTNFHDLRSIAGL